MKKEAKEPELLPVAELKIMLIRDEDLSLQRFSFMIVDRSSPFLFYNFPMTGYKLGQMTG